MSDRYPLCIYHGTCQDGFASAWVVRKALKGRVEFFAAVHGEPIPPKDLLANRDIYIVDFCYAPAQLQQILNVAQYVRVLDHHKSAREQYPPGLVLDVRTADQLLLHFDMERSGCGIAWAFFTEGGMPNVPDTMRGQSLPKLLQHVQDRDLWRYNLPGTAEVCAALFSYPYDFNTWDEFIDYQVPNEVRGGSMYMADVPLNKLRDEGKALIRKQAQDIVTLLPLTRRMTEIAGYQVPIANMPVTMVSDAGHAMAREGFHFAACYYDTPGWRNYALRSVEGGIDVSEIAKLFGGGGHKHAAGFRLALSTVPVLVGARSISEHTFMTQPV